MTPKECAERYAKSNLHGMLKDSGAMVFMTNELIVEISKVEAAARAKAFEEAAITCQREATRQQASARRFQKDGDNEHRESKANVRASQSLYCARLIRARAKEAP